jgi:hypothetical protein
MKTRFTNLWTQHNYLFYVIEGHKVWHTANGAYRVGKDSCVFVRKGGFILDGSLLELKFKELILNVADNALNTDLLAYFCSLLHEPQTATRSKTAPLPASERS